MSRKNRRRKPVPEGEFEACVSDLSEDGRGVARVDGKVCFIAGALPDEQVRFAYSRMNKNADEGFVTAVIQASPDRVTPPCAHFGDCGGCSLQHLSADAQITLKQQRLLETLKRIGKVEPEQLAAAVRGASQAYRRRARLSVKYLPSEDRVLVGFRDRSGRRLARIQQCQVLDARVGQKLTILAECIAGLSIRDQIPQIEIACADRVALVFRVLKTPTAQDLLKLDSLATSEGFDVYLQTGGPKTIAPMRPPASPLHFSPDGSQTRLRFEPTDFVQIHAEVSQKAVLQALDWLQPRGGENVLELFCGLGNFSLPLARAGARLTAVEGEPALVQRARENALAQGASIRFEAADLFAPFEEHAWSRQDFDAVLLDPPRAGAEVAAEWIGKQGIARVLYVSCHPGTLARDAARLVHEYGYRLLRTGVMDMFPHTAHVESMALFVHSSVGDSPHASGN